MRGRWAFLSFLTSLCIKDLKHQGYKPQGLHVSLFILFFRYTLDLSDIQMVVCNVKDNWSEVGSTPFMTSDVHVVDKFTIAIQMER